MQIVNLHSTKKKKENEVIRAKAKRIPICSIYISIIVLASSNCVLVRTHTHNSN